MTDGGRVSRAEDEWQNFNEPVLIVYLLSLATFPHTQRESKLAAAAPSASESSLKRISAFIKMLMWGLTHFYVDLWGL